MTVYPHARATSPNVLVGSPIHAVIRQSCTIDLAMVHQKPIRLKLMMMFLLMLLVVAASSQAAVCELNCALGHQAVPMAGNAVRTAAIPIHRSHCSESEHALKNDASSQAGNRLNMSDEGQCKHRAFHFDVQASADTRVTAMDCVMVEVFSSDCTPSITSSAATHGTPPLPALRSPLLFSLRV